jgi:hypothetical protein
MVLLFLPTMAHVAVETYLASAAVVRDRNVVFGLPVEAGLNSAINTIG